MRLQSFNIFVIIFISLVLLFLAVDLDIQEEVEERLLLDLLGLLLSSFLLVLLLHDLDGDVLALLPGDLVAETLLDDLTVQVELLRQFQIGEPLVFGEVESHPQLLEVCALAGLHLLEVSEEGLVPFLDFLADDVAVHEDLEPVLGDLLLGEVVVFGFEFLFSEEVVDFLEVSVGEVVLALDDGVDLVDEGLESITEFLFDGLGFGLEFLVESALLDEVGVQGDGLNLFLEGRESLDLVLNLFLDINLIFFVTAIFGAIRGALLLFFLFSLLSFSSAY